MRITQSNFYGDPNLGLYARVCDKFCLVGNSISEKNVGKIREYLNTKVKRCSIANTDFIGLFAAVNSNGILLPKIVNDNEFYLFKKITEEFGVDLEILNSKFSALGNLILCNDNGAIVSRLFRKSDIDKIKDCLDVEVLKTKIAGTDIVGSCGVATNKGCLLHRDTSEKEIYLIEEVLKVDVDIGTANFGSPFVSSCMIANSNGVLIGDRTTAPELTRIIDTLKLE